MFRLQMSLLEGHHVRQDLSVAGKRAGLAGERSGLFMEQIRVIKEMREKDAESGRTGADIRPRFMVWENTCGAFSVNEGRDFAAILEETLRVAEPEVPDIHVPEGGWTLSGSYVGRRSSVAWRVLDAQFWGVPQRRRRIALISDFGGQCAAKVLFESNSLYRHLKPCEAQGQTTSGDATDCSGTAGRPESRLNTIALEGNGSRESHKGDGYSVSDTMYTLNTVEQHSVCYSIPSVNSAGALSDNPHAGYSVSESARTLDVSGGNPACNQGGIAIVSPDVARTLTARNDGSPCVDRGPDVVCIEMTSTKNTVSDSGISPTLTARMGTGGNQVNAVCVKDQKHTAFDMLGFGDYGESDTASTVKARDYKDATDLVCDTSDVAGAAPKQKYIVRRLTVLECTRLQGFPCKWLDIGDWYDDNGKLHKESDSVKYKALGNSIAIPVWLFVLGNLNEYCEDKTMASLFSGIDGFPLIWSFLNGKENCVWSSEIDSFCNAVSRIRFPDTSDQAEDTKKMSRQ